MTLLSSSPAAASPYRMPVTIPLEEPSSRGTELVTADGRSLSLVGAELRVESGGGLARIVLEQRFENPFDETLHVTYKMPLPAEGAVSGYAFQIGGRTIEGRVDRKEVARERFERALVEGKTAALLEQERADIFKQEIGNIPARQSIVARITIDQRLAWLPTGEWELRFPTVIGPRYIGSTETADDARAVGIEVAPEGIGARIRLTLHISDELAPGKRASSASHALRLQSDGTIELDALEGARLDRDLLVRWPVAEAKVGLSLQTARPLQTAPHGRFTYGLLTIVPPEKAREEAIPRDLIVLLDTSGSMGGPPLQQAQRVVASLIDSLGDSDRLELVEFSTRPQRYAPGPREATPAEKRSAIAWVLARTAGGGTEMYSGILEALRSLRGGAQRQVVLVTDGCVGGEGQLVTLLHESLPQGCRLHVVGVGSAVNRTLSTSIARAGRGAEILVALTEDAEKASKALLDRTRAPVLTDLVIEGAAVVEHAPEGLPDVFAGAPVLAALKLNPEGGEIVVRGRLASGPWEQRVRAGATRSGDGNPAIVQLYARERVADLETRWTMGRETNAIDREIESLGVIFQIATRRTTWVAIDEDSHVDPSKASRREVIPQELPHGMTLGCFPLASPAGPVLMDSAPAYGMAPAQIRSPAPARSPAPPGMAAPTRQRTLLLSPAMSKAPAPPSMQAMDEGGDEATRAMPSAAPQSAPIPTAAPSDPIAPKLEPVSLQRKSRAVLIVIALVLLLLLVIAIFVWMASR